MSNDQLTERMLELVHVVAWVFRAAIIIGGLITVDIVLKVLMNYRIRLLLRRVEALATIAEHHGAITDKKVSELKTATANAAKGIAKVVQSSAAEVAAVLPSKTADEVARKVIPPSTDGTIPTVGGPP